MNTETIITELREERDWAQARVEELEAEAERNAWTISPEMVQTRNDQLAAENAALRARVAELVAALQSIAAGDGDERRRAEDALARAESATPAKHPDTEFWQPASTAPENAKDVLAYYQGVYGPCLGFLSGKRFHPYGSSGSEPFTHWARVPAIDAARKQGGAT